MTSEKWFVYDPDNGLSFYKSETEAKSDMEKFVGILRDEAIRDEWSSDVEYICMGKVTRTTRLVQLSKLGNPEFCKACGESQQYGNCESCEFFEAVIEVVGE